MQRHRRSLLVLSVAALMMTALGAIVAARAERTQGDDPMAFARGAQSWANNCARCHNMRDASELRDDQWRVVVGHMRLRAGLTASESKEILLFLQGSN